LSSGERQEYRAAWQRVIDYRLLDWIMHPESLTEDGDEAPSSEVLSTAIRLAAALGDEACPPPHRVAATADGEIVFERGDDQVFEVIRIQEDCSIEYLRFHGDDVVERSPWKSLDD